MREIIARTALPLFSSEIDRDEAIGFFQAKGEKYKAQLIQDLPASETITLYSQGDWIDLCRGPHMRSTADVGPAFKLMKVAGAYWRGDHRNAMLSRIYGTAWRDQKELDAYLHQSGGSGTARPPQDRQGDGPVPHPGGGRRVDLLASEGLETLPHGGSLHAPPPRRRWLSGGEDPAAWWTAPYGNAPATGTTFREHMFVVPRWRRKTSSSP